MESVVLVIHLMLALSIIGLVLLQRSEGGGLGIGGGSGGGMGGFASSKTVGNVLTRATTICVACFFATSLILGILAGTHTSDKGLIDKLGEIPLAVEGSIEIETPKEPTVPISK